MALFSKKSTGAEETRAPRNPSNIVAFRLLAVAYVGYLCIQIIKLYTAGGPDAPSLPMLIVGLVLLGGGGIVLAVLSYKEWKRNKPAYDAYMAELRADAEAKRAAEEAAEAEEDFGDDEDLLLPEETGSSEE